MGSIPGRHLLAAAVSLLLVASVRADAASPPGLTTGVPWRGARGVTESVASIMARSRAADHGSDSVIEARRPGLRSVLPPGGAAGSGEGAGLVSAELTAQSIGLNFKTMGVFTDSGFIPPDTMGDVGPTQILATANGRIKVFDKATGAV